MLKKIIMFFLLFISNLAFSQVGINTVNPNTNTLLHVSEDPNNIKGIIIPRLTENERNKLTYSDDSTVVRLEEKDNSLMIFNIDENCYNYWDSGKNKWESLCGSQGNATFSFNCDTDVALHGNYIKGEKVGTNEYITINNNVTKAGDYFISVTSDKDNGYSFIGSGTFTHTGNHVVKLYAQGTPKESSETQFTINSSGSYSQTYCSLNVKVQEARANYVINSQSTVVNGEYYKGKALDSNSNNTITLSINVYKAGSYSISTNTVNGINFSKSGVFSNSDVNTTQLVKLIGNGTPTINNDFDVIITSNSTENSATSIATIPITLPEMYVAIIGKYPSNYSWYSDARQYGFDSEKQAFSPTGKFKIKKINILWSVTDADSAVDNLNTTKKPDVILYYSYKTPPNDDLASALGSYTRRGGVLIFGSNSFSQDSEGNDYKENASQVESILKGIYGSKKNTVIVWRGGLSFKETYQINNLPNDPIINGPFGNLSSKFFGEDLIGGSIVVKNQSSTAVQIASGNNPAQNIKIEPNFSLIWYDSAYNFVYIGTSTLSGDTSRLTNTDAWPSIFNETTGLPTVKPAYGFWFNTEKSGQNPVYNSALEYNILAWSLKRAAEMGINKH